MSERVFLADFGLAKSVITGSRLTRSGETLGTPAYMSPEQARGDLAALAPASDVWALGCVAHELCAGQPPFARESPALIVGAVLTQPPPRLVGVPAGLRTVLANALAKAAHRRPPTAAAFRDECAVLLAGGSPRRRSAVPTGWAIAAGMLLASLAGGGWAC